MHLLVRLAPLALLPLAACSPAGEAMSRGEVREEIVTVHAEPLEIRVPSRTISVSVGEPAASIGSGSNALTAPAGGSLVAVSWSLGGDNPARVTGFDAATALGLRTSDGDVDVREIPDTPDTATGGAVVALGEGEEVEAVTATYDGVAQVIGLDGSREPGRADELYDPTHDGTPLDCADDLALRGRATLTAELECTVSAWSLPYLPGQGWADEGSTHLVVEPHVVLWKVTEGGDRYRTRFVLGTDTIDGASPTGALAAGKQGPGSAFGRLEVTVPTGASEWTTLQSYELTEHATGPRVGERVELAGKVTLPPAS